MFAATLLVLGIVFASQASSSSFVSRTELTKQEKLLKKSIVRLVAKNGEHGTGFAIEHKKKRFILTNAHVCADEEYMYSKVDGVEYAHRVLKIGKKHDICMVQGLRSLEPIKLSKRVYADEKVYTMGYPLSRFKIYSEGRLKGVEHIQMKWGVPVDKCVNRAHLSVQLERSYRSPFGFNQVCVLSAKFYFTTLLIDSGASGSPVINSRGELVGIISLSSGNISFGMAVPHYEIRDFLKE